MLDFFTIFSKGGILMWCFKEAGLQQKEWDAFTPAVNAFIKAVLLQGNSVGNGTSGSHGSAAAFESGSLALKYRLDNEFELVFVAAYQKMLPLLYLDRLLDEIQLRFRDRFMSELRDRKFHALAKFRMFSDEFARILAKVEASSRAREHQKKSEMRSFVESSKSQKTVASMIETGSNNNNNNHHLTNNAATATGGLSKKKMSSSQHKAASTEDENDEDDDEDEAKGEEIVLENKVLANNVNNKMAAIKASKKAFKGKSPKAEKVPKKGKEKTVWDPFVFGGRGATGEEARMLDRSNQNKDGSNSSEDHQVVTDAHLAQFLPDSSAVGHSANLGDIDAEDSDEELLEIEAMQDNKKSGYGIWASLSSLVGSKKLTREDIEPVISKMRDHLISKNVASDVSLNLCESLALKLEGRVCGTFSTIHRSVKDALTEALMQLLTPRRRVDIIRDVYEAKRNSRPYVVTFCGVNGVGKSTNLAKICFWLVENKFRVLIAACDTFRAGAVEQLRTHSKRLNSLYPASNQTGGKPVVELYEKGYGKDAAGIAMEAINYARQAKIDVVLVDTAGRMQDNEPLMRSLTKLISVNDPDLVLFVGEALVGNEAVDQLVKFNKALADHSQSHTTPHLIDGIVLTKFDTIDDKVGSAISMTYITGQPIVFVGTGQTYTDLKSLNARAVVQSLMK